MATRWRPFYDGSHSEYLGPGGISMDFSSVHHEFHVPPLLSVEPQDSSVSAEASYTLLLF